MPSVVVLTLNSVLPGPIAGAWTCSCAGAGVCAGAAVGVCTATGSCAAACPEEEVEVASAVVADAESPPPQAVSQKAASTPAKAARQPGFRMGKFVVTEGLSAAIAAVVSIKNFL